MSTGSLLFAIVSVSATQAASLSASFKHSYIFVLLFFCVVTLNYRADGSYPLFTSLRQNLDVMNDLLSCICFPFLSGTLGSVANP